MKVLYYFKWRLILFLPGLLITTFATITGPIERDMENLFVIGRWAQLIALVWILILIMLVSNPEDELKSQ